ncbi:MAG: S-methyl-5-thioribose-1-phosphate isomerase [Oscillospiraceae bacterium]|nr:S-methyl-5-thioribose-1-phosphate isomerase [Oscillospiraceae bacterium]
MSMNIKENRQNILYDKDSETLYILDQSLLPGEIKTIPIEGLDRMIEAIKALRIRGAPAIGIFAGYCVYALSLPLCEKEDRLALLREQTEKLSEARPTAVNLAWACGRLMKCAEDKASLPGREWSEALYKEACFIHEDDISKCRAISEYGLSLIKDGDGILTHCNAGPLATSKYGTGLGPLLLGRERGMNFRAYTDETRPLLQGARLTSYELFEAGIDETLICDNMASFVMKKGLVNACFVGCDRVAANGDTANKIGTSGVAILAKHYGIPFYVLGPTSTIDYSCPDGEHIPIEMRSPDEIKNMWYSKPMAPEGVKCLNPAFDVTDAELITAIITEKGICYPPFSESLAAIREK